MQFVAGITYDCTFVPFLSGWDCIYIRTFTLWQGITYASIPPTVILTVSATVPPLVVTGAYLCLYLLFAGNIKRRTQFLVHIVFFLVMKTFCSALLPCLVWFRLEVTLKAACKNARISHHNEKGQLKGKVTKCSWKKCIKFPEFWK